MIENIKDNLHYSYILSYTRGMHDMGRLKKEEMTCQLNL